MHFSKLKRSPWTTPYSTEVPAQPGVYECEWPEMPVTTVWFNYWDGKSWHWGAEEPQLCERYDPIAAGIVADGMRRWRGITFHAALACCTEAGAPA